MQQQPPLHIDKGIKNKAEYVFSNKRTNVYENLGRKKKLKTNTNANRFTELSPIV